MQSTLKPKQTDDPHDVVAVAPDVARVVPAFEELTNLLRHAARQQSDPQTRNEPGFASASPIPPVDTTFRPTAVAVDEVQNNVRAAGSRRSIGSRLARAFTALLLATCLGVFGVVWQRYGDVATQMIAKSAPQFLSSLLPAEKPAPSVQAAAPAVVADAASTDASNAAPPQPASPAQAAPESVAPAAAAPAPEQAQLLQSMAHDLASLGQQVEQLKTSIDELKAGQQQVSRDIAKASEQSLRPKIAAAPALPQRPAPARPRKPVTPLPPPQAAMAPPLPQASAPYVPPAVAPYVPQTAAPYAPRQVEPPPQATAQPQQDEDLATAPRPPMPVR
jgi:hypothetical protein